MTRKKQQKADPKRIPVSNLEEDSRAAEPGESGEPEELAEKTEVKERDLEAELAAMTENWQRERAGFMNYKRRVEEEKSEIRKYACWDLAHDLLRVLDYFESSVSFAEKLPDEANSVLVGVKYTIDELTRILAAHGVCPIDAEAGQPYDSSCMEAVERRSMGDAEAVGEVLEVRRRGWRLRDKVLRSAEVVVAVAAEDDMKEAEEKGGE